MAYQNSVAKGMDGNKKKSASSVESLLPLSSLQLPYWVHNARKPLAGQIQVQFRLHGIGSTQQLQQAWSDTQQQFQCLRSTVNVAPNQQPVLVVRKFVNNNFTTANWSDITATEQEQEVAKWLAADRQTPLSLEKAPCSRLFCARLTDTTVFCVWSCHHLLLDGWSSAVVVNRLLVNYHNLHRPDQNNHALRPAQCDTPVQRQLPDYVEYRQFLDTQPKQQSEAFWRKALHGFTNPTIICNHPAETAVSRAIRQLDKPEVEQLKQFCKAQAITFATAVQIAWALTCAHQLNRTDIVFGLVTHGRSLDFAGIDNVAGLLSNVIPARSNIEPQQILSKWAKNFQAQQFEARNHEHISLNEVLSFSEPATRTRAFDSVLAIETLPIIQPEQFDSPSISHYASDTISAFPASVTVVPADVTQVKIEIRNDRFAETLAESLADKLLEILTRLPASAELNLATFINAERQLTLAPEPRPAIRFRDTYLRKIISARTELELKVISIWEDVLQTYPLSMDSNFFASSGDSLGVLRLLTRIKSEFGTDINLAHFIENPTVTAMCKYLNTEELDRPIKSLVLLRKGTQKNKLFCLHAGGGHALFYRPLALRLNNSYSVYGLQPSSLGGDTIPSENVSDMVDDYLQEITSVQPQGPYHLLCYCFGAALTLEIIKKLQAQGAEIGHVIIADAAAPIPSNHPMSRVGWKGYVIYELIAQGHYKSTIIAVQRQLHRWIEALARLKHTRTINKQTSDKDSATKSALKDDTAISSETTANSTRGHLSKVQTACERAFRKYRATRCDCHIHILRSDSSTLRMSFDVFTRHWRTIAPNQTEHRIDETHANIMAEPCVASTAVLVNSIIEQ